MSRLYRSIVAVSRTVHVYLTMFALLLMMFFAVTGLLLNHEDWLGADTIRPTDSTGEIAPALLSGPDRLMVVETLRSQFGAVGAVSTFDVDDQTIRVEMKGPGRHTEAEIDRRTGKVDIHLERRGLFLRLDDLHRGKDSGPVWSWVLDASAILLLVGSVTGLLMWIGLPRRRRLGLVALIGSTVICLVIYLAFVP
ncbi:MAG: PepSY-associated TM helix domain-containing protein [Gemmatimonadota bacterium]